MMNFCRSKIVVSLKKGNANFLFNYLAPQSSGSSPSFQNALVLRKEQSRSYSYNQTHRSYGTSYRHSSSYQALLSRFSEVVSKSSLASPFSKRGLLILLSAVGIVNSSSKVTTEERKEEKKEETKPQQTLNQPAPSSTVVLPNEFEIFTHIAWTFWDSLIVLALTVLTFGAGYLSYPLVDFWHLQKSISQMRFVLFSQIFFFI